jgi:hypothetical protein
MEGRFHDHHRSDVDHGAKQLGKQNKKHREHKRGGGGKGGNKKIILLKCTFMKELHIFSWLNYLVSHFSVDLPRLHHALVLDFLD